MQGELSDKTDQMEPGHFGTCDKMDFTEGKTLGRMNQAKRDRMTNSLCHKGKIWCLNTPSLHPAIIAVAYLRASITRREYEGERVAIRNFARKHRMCIEAVGSFVMSHRRRCLGDLI